jgi:hypothetical protein
VARASRGASLSGSTAVSVVPAVAAATGAVLVLAGGPAAGAGAVLVLAYAAMLVFSGLHAGIRFRSPAVAVLQPPAVVATHASYLYGFVRGLLGRPSPPTG